MGFDDLRPKRAQEYDTWGKIGSLHKAPEQRCDAVTAKPEDELEEGDPCPGCETKLSWIWEGVGHPSASCQLGCKGCGERFGESFP